MVLTKKQIRQFLLYTFGMTFLLHGILAVLTNKNIIILDNPIAMLLYVLGTLSPTIIAYILLKKYEIIEGFQSFLKTIFSFKVKTVSYLLVALLLIAQYIYVMFEWNIFTDFAWFMPIVMFFLCVFDGGLEEVGWRYLLQVTLMKKYSFIISTTITAITWFLWHIPHFFIIGSSQNSMDPLIFFMVILSGSFALAAAYYISNNILICILLHAAFNAGSFIFPFTQNYVIMGVSTACSITVSLVIVFFHKKYNNKSNKGVV